MYTVSDNHRYAHTCMYRYWYIHTFKHSTCIHKHISTFFGVRVLAECTRSLIIAGESVREMGFMEAWMSMEGLSIGPVMVAVMEQGRRTYGNEGMKDYKFLATYSLISRPVDASYSSTLTPRQLS